MRTTNIHAITQHSLRRGLRTWRPDVTPIRLRQQRAGACEVGVFQGTPEVTLVRVDVLAFWFTDNAATSSKPYKL